MDLILPRTTKDGKPRVSYSQVTLFREIKSFHLKVEGRLEYMAKYFLGYNQADVGWGQFGKDVEAYIHHRKKAEFFTDAEKEILNKIKPLGVPSTRFTMDLGDFALEGEIDDRLENWGKIIDYKTCSSNSKKQYYEDSYKQLDIYAMYVKQLTGKVPDLEVCMIERKGSLFKGGGREKLTVGKEIWTLKRETSEERMEMIKQEITETVHEISEYYKIFLQLNK